MKKLQNMKNIITFLIICGVSVFIAFALFEGYLRFERAQITTKSLKELELDHKRTYWTLAPNKRQIFVNDKKEPIEIISDEYGYRNAPGTIEDSDIVFLGDSYGISVNVSEDEILTSRLRKKGLKIYNAAINGTGTYHQYFILKDLFEHHKFKYVVLLSMADNDFKDNYFYSEPHKELIHAENSNFLKDEQQVGFKQTKEKQRLSFKPYIHDICQLSSACTKVYQDIWLGLIKGFANDPYRISDYFYLTMIDTQENKVAQKAYIDTKNAFKAMKELAESNGAKLIVIHAPSRKQALNVKTDFLGQASFLNNDQYLSYLQDMYIGDRIDMDRSINLLAKICQELEIPFKSLKTEMRSSPEREDFYGLLDAHWIGTGQKKAAELFYPWLSRQMR